MRRRLAIAALVAVLGTALWLARGTGLGRLFPGAAPHNLLLISIDTLRSDRLGCYGYAAAQTPHLDALAARGLRFEGATTVTPLTLPAHSSLMTGTFPAYHGVRDNGGFYLAEQQITLAETLRDAGYRTGGFIGAFVLDGRWGIGQGFERYFDDFDLSKFDEAPGMDAIQRPGSRVVDKALAWLAADVERPFLAWVHLYDPHTPYEAPEPFRSRFPATLSGAYDAEIAATDAEVGRLLEHLESEGRLDDTLVVVLGDHGEMLGEHREQTHGFFIYEAALRIPLIVAGPSLPARTLTDLVRIVDVLPTVLELLGVGAPEPVQGRSLMPLTRGENLGLMAHAESWYPRYHYGWSELQSIRDGRYKLIRAPRRELYDIVADPGELNDIAEREPRRADALERALERLLTRVTSDEPQQPSTMDPETAARLQALGYLGGGARRDHLEDRPRGDPKDKIRLYNLLKRAAAASSEDRLEQAIELAERALREDPEVIEAHTLLGNVLKKAHRFAEALQAYRRALELDPEHDGALYLLALTYKDMGRLEEARDGLERARTLDPRNGKVLWQLADLLMRQGSLEEAEGVLKNALKLDLDQPRFLKKLGECYVEMGRWQEAETSLRRALAERPDLEGAHFDLALVHEERGAIAQAIESYEAELAHNPEGFRAAFNLAKLLQKTGRLQAAVQRYEEAVEVRPGFATGHLYLARALLDTGELATAEESARRGLAANPDPEIALLGHFVLADVYNRQGRLEEAEREVAAARRLERGD